MRASRWLLLACAGLFAACTTVSPTTDLTEPQIVPATETTQATIPPEVSWTVIGDNLALSPTWMDSTVRMDFDMQLTETALIAQAGSEAYANPINTAGPRIEFEQGFGVSFEMEMLSGDFAGISLYGSLSEGEWWQGIRRLDIGAKSGNVAIGYWDGSSATPIVWNEYPTSGIYGNHAFTLGVRATRNEFIVLKNGHEIGRMTNPDLFASGEVLLGLNVAPENQLTLYTLFVEAPDGNGVTIK